MKIYTRVVIDMDTLQTIEESSYEYVGAIADCKGGGSGGGAPGAIDYPAYMKTRHNDWLDAMGVDTILYSVTKLMSTAMTGASPYAGYVEPNVDTAFLGAAALSTYESPFQRLVDLATLNVETLYASYLVDDTAQIAASVQAESNLLDDEINTKIMTKLQAGMVDANAVQSSAFVLANALIWDGKVKMVAKHDADIRLARLTSGADLAVRRMQAIVEFKKTLALLGTENARIYLAARHDLDGFAMEIAAKDVTFDLNTFQYGVNVMSSLHGSAVSAADQGSYKTGLSAGISGALAGAAAGAMIGTAFGGPGIGTGIGAAVGFAAAYM